MRNQKGSIIVYALTAIAVMAISATAISVTTIFELQKSKNTQQAVFATYDAEQGMEYTLFLLNRSLRSGKSLTDFQNMIGMPDNDEILNCIEPSACLGCTGPIGCEQIHIKTDGTNKLPITLIDPNEAITINLFDPDDRNKVPYPGDLFYHIRKIIIDWNKVTIVDKTFELSLAVWDIQNKDDPAIGIRILPPIKREITATATSQAIFDLWDVCGSSFLSLSEEEPVCTMGTSDIGHTYIGKIRIRLLTGEPIIGGTLQLKNTADETKPIPGFIEITSLAKEGSNKQAIKVIGSLGTGGSGLAVGQQVTQIWDYAIYSNRSISK
jgi:hypothetical protein